MKTRNFHTFTETETLIASGYREIGAQARVAAMGSALVLGRARLGQLGRDRDRALRKGDHARAVELDGQIATMRALAIELASQRERESVVPTPVPADEAVVRGRITDGGVGRKGLNLNLIDAEGEIVSRTRSTEKGAFELIHPPRKTLTLRVTNSRGNHLLDRDGIDGPGPGGACYLEIPVDGIVPMPPPPDPPDSGGDPTHVTVPSLRGLTVEAASEAARGAKLRSKVTGQVPAPNLAGRVVDQKPQAGATVKKGSTIGVTIGVAEENGFPDFRDAPIREAVEKIAGLDLSIQEIALKSGPDQAGLVLTHLPAPDAPFTTASRVFLSVGIGEPKADLSTAVFLITREASVADLNMTDAKMREQLDASGISTLDELRQVVAADPEKFREALQIDDPVISRRLRRITATVMARFPAG